MGVNGVLRAAGFARLAAIFTLVHDRMSAWPGHGYQQTGRRLGYRPAIALAVAAVAFSSMCQTAEAQHILVYPLDGSQVLEKLNRLKETVSSIRIPKCRQSEGEKENIERLEAALRLDGNVNVSPDFDLQPRAGRREHHHRGSDYQEAVKQAEETLAKLKALPPCNPKPKARHPGKGKGVKNLHMPQRQRIGMGSDVPHVELASWTPGLFVGAQFTGSSSSVTTSEFFSATGMRTNQFDDRASSFGGGVNFGYDWQPWGNNVVIGMVFDINAPNASVRHDFLGGNYIGSVVNFTASALARGGILVTPNVLLYGQTGISVANQPISSSRLTSVALRPMTADGPPGSP
jgi:hypothetical protein